MRSLIFHEYETLEGVELSAAEAAALAPFRDKLSTRPGMLGGTYDLTATSYVGAVQIGSLSIEIRPKVPVERVLFLIGYAADPAAWLELSFDYASEDSLIEALIPGFAAAVRRAISRGLLEGYRQVEEALPVLRGRIRFDEQIRRHHARFPPAELRYDEFTEDILENRLIRAAILKLNALRIRSAGARRLLRSLAAAFGGVSAEDFEPRHVPEITYTQLNRHYRGAAELARLVLRSFSISHRRGEASSSAFLIDMNAVFETFVVTALREALHADARSFPANAKGRELCLDAERRLRLQPDLSWWRGGRCICVGDAKYKATRGSGHALHPDVYQALAYAVALGLPRATLIYAAGEGDEVLHRVPGVNKEIHVRVLDLSLPPEALLAQVAAIAQEIRSRTVRLGMAA